ncbi:MAG: hypothetical protein Ct9H300mP13_5550 [Gammaproteobacteria bacterium]|nr:MAG: hypothetical protein Ct9H300mP13_5550 [Gammaproteobacteria bacterium]
MTFDRIAAAITTALPVEFTEDVRKMCAQRCLRRSRRWIWLRGGDGGSGKSAPQDTREIGISVDPARIN